jgi:hypothetical protein
MNETQSLFFLACSQDVRAATPWDFATQGWKGFFNVGLGKGREGPDSFSRTSQALLESKFTSAFEDLAAKQAPPDAAANIHPLLQEVHNDLITIRRARKR